MSDEDDGAAAVRALLDGAPRLVVLDDDPTGTQTVRDLPVLTGWAGADIRWALQQPAPAFFVLTNTRSLSPANAERRVRAVAEACFAAADGVELAFASRSDSTLRGHFPVEVDALAAVAAERGRPAQQIVLLPAYVDAGRVTEGGVHRLRTPEGLLLPVGESEFARDATFGYRSSSLAEWVGEKTGGRIPAARVATIPLAAVRDPGALAAALRSAEGAAVVAPDVVTDEDVRAVAVALLRDEARGVRRLHQVGPSFVRARAGQVAAPPLEAARLAGLVGAAPGLVVVGSHVALTTRQLARLHDRIRCTDVVLDVDALLRGGGRVIAEARSAVVAGLRGTAPVVLATSRSRVDGSDAAASLAIARRVSEAVTTVVRDAVAAVRPGYVLAKGGITSAAVATDALGVRRAWVRGTLLPGIVSVWEAADGTAAGIPVVVFAGNVGDDEALADAVARLEQARTETTCAS